MTKRAFTLVELLVVTGIIASMATIGIGSYGAIQRGMANRGAIAAATSIMSLAQNRARIDMTPTVVYFLNELVQDEDTTLDTVQRIAGVAIAIRRAGRVTRFFQDYVYDEYGDLEHTYPTVDGQSSSSDKDAGFRLYRFDLSDMKYSIAKSAVERRVIPCSADDKDWCVKKPTGTGVIEAPFNGMADGDIATYAFALKDNKGVTWNVGDAYGYEFARIRLPDNYIFGTGGNRPTSSDPVKFYKAIPFFSNSTYNKALESMPISTIQRDGNYKSIGSTPGRLEGI